MGKIPLWIPIILGISVIAAIIFFINPGAVKYYHVPRVSLLPSGATPTVSRVLPPTSPAVRPTSVYSSTTPEGLATYIIKGKFVTNPMYNAQQILQSDFVIDEDPLNHRIPVIMTSKTGKISVIRYQKSSRGTTVLGPEDTDSFRQSVKVNAPVLLHLFLKTPGFSEYDRLIQKVMKDVMGGNWSIPSDFVLYPAIVRILP
jgi:hypothetical protein